MIYLEFSTISSPGGTRDLFVDFTNALEAGESIVTPTVTSSDPLTLEVSKVAVNTVVTPDGAAPGKGIYFSVETLLEAKTTVLIEVGFVGDSGSADTYVVAIPVAHVVSI